MTPSTDPKAMTTDAPLSDEEIAKVEALEEAATPGPWETKFSGNNGGIPLAFLLLPGATGVFRRIADGAAQVELIEEDAAFIAAARSFVPRAIKEIRKLRLAVVGEMETEEFGRAILAAAREEAAKENAALRAQARKDEAALRDIYGEVEDLRLERGYHARIARVAEVRLAARIP